MLIAQLTDLHLGFEADNPSEFNRQRLDTAVTWLNNLTVKPDMLFLTGDLTDRGDIESYERLRDAMGNCKFPVYLCVGNHDDRTALREVFPHVALQDGFIQYVVDTADVRFVVIDTLEDGHHGGAFCANRAAWLRARIEEVGTKPVMIVLHHPPIETGIGWMTTMPEEQWVRTLDAAIGDRANVSMICGHIHRSITTRWKGRFLAIAPSTAPQVALDLSPIDPDRPDDRPMIVAEAPGAALHLWTEDGFVTHHAAVGDPLVLARYTDLLQPLVRSLADERIEGSKGAKPSNVSHLRIVH
jgi:Icc protein